MTGPSAGQGPARLTAADLQSAGRAISAPFRIELARPVDGEAGAGSLGDVPGAGLLVVECDEVLRLLPGRRLVAKARIGARPVLLKLFLGSGAHRHARREADGTRLLRAAGIPTPRLLGMAAAPDGAAHALLFDWLDNARPLDPNDTTGIIAAARALARLHAAGLRHTDLHLGNIVLTDNRPGLHFVDADGVRGSRRQHGDGLGRGASLANLALLCAQRPPRADADLAAILGAYLETRGWSGADGQLAALGRKVARSRNRRVRLYLRKTGRACSEFHLERERGATRICVRDCWTDAMRRFLGDPEAMLSEGILLKDGNSATVVRVQIGACTWIVKRYNVKSLWHRIRRSLRPRARSRNSWRNGQRLHFLEIPTARPVALLERHQGPLRGTAYLVMEDLGDTDLRTAAAQGLLDGSIIEAVIGLFATLRSLGLLHGDTKATNFLLPGGRRIGMEDTGGRPTVALIDLDSMREDARGSARDVERFLANWAGQPDLAHRFREAFRAAGLPVP